MPVGIACDRRARNHGPESRPGCPRARDGGGGSRRRAGRRRQHAAEHRRHLLVGIQKQAVHALPRGVAAGIGPCGAVRRKLGDAGQGRLRVARCTGRRRSRVLCAARLRPPRRRSRPHPAAAVRCAGACCAGWSLPRSGAGSALVPRWWFRLGPATARKRPGCRAPAEPQPAGPHRPDLRDLWRRGRRDAAPRRPAARVARSCRWRWRTGASGRTGGSTPRAFCVPAFVEPARPGGWSRAARPSPSRWRRTCSSPTPAASGARCRSCC